MVPVAGTVGNLRLGLRELDDLLLGRNTDLSGADQFGEHLLSYRLIFGTNTLRLRMGYECRSNGFGGGPGLRESSENGRRRNPCEQRIAQRQIGNL